ncbi:kinase-like domain-containing protein [Chaetomidium leptoderma]|uniref:Kinase-like domain-containing protein n=1 Tax=Chaetomidium leptoderma TaxID=669021 RepID=A0AAN6VGE1_9PEZI|nr:kinase-like domain-containing protein [Chaetomidium leptoderma]
MSDEIHFPSGFSMKDLVAYGNTGLVLLDSSTDTIVKASPDGERSDAMAVEQQIYERFVQRGGHKGILIYHGTFEWGIRLEHASHGNIRSYLETHPADELRRIRWAVQVAEALDFAHQCGVIHGDINGFNVLLDRHLDAKLADFAGSSLDDSPLLIAVTASHEYPGPLLCTEADIFALGSTLYELMNESRPHAGLSDTAIAHRYKRGEFAETESLGIVGSIIKKCWQGEYKECRQVVRDLKGDMFLPPMQTILENTHD